MTIYERINHLCDDRNSSVNALCKELNISNGNQKTWKNDNINIEQLKKVCNYLNVSADYIIGLDSKKISPVITTEDGYNELAERITHLSHSELEELDLYLAFLEYRRNLRS